MNRTEFLTRYSNALKSLNDIKGYEMEKKFLEYFIDAVVEYTEEQRLEIQTLKLNNALIRIEAKEYEILIDRVIKGHPAKTIMKNYLEIIDKFKEANKKQNFHE